MYWFAATNFRNQALSTPGFFFYYDQMYIDLANTGPLREIFMTMMQTLQKFLACEYKLIYTI